MTLAEKKQFIKQLTTSIQQEMIAHAYKYPDHWDGIELRWLLAEKFQQATVQRSKIRKADFNNTVCVENL